MIDIVFLLLIFFIVTWQFSRSEMDLKVSVPTSSEGVDNRRNYREIIINALYAGARESAILEHWPELVQAGGGSFSAIDPVNRL